VALENGCINLEECPFLLDQVNGFKKGGMIINGFHFNFGRHLSKQMGPPLFPRSKNRDFSLCD